MGTREALIIAAATFDDVGLAGLRSPARDASALAEVLADPAIGGFEVRQLVDQPHRPVTRTLEQFFARRGASDTLVCYVSSHGVKDDDGRLYFAVTDTERDWLRSTAVPAAFLRDLMDRCRARSIVLILDCCYSGAFIPGVKADRGLHLKEELEGRGRAILTASSAIEYAWEGGEASGTGTPSVFTAAVVDGLRSGAADLDGDGLVSIDDLSTFVFERLRSLGAAQTPMKWTFGVAGTVYLARRPAPQDDQVTLPAVLDPTLGLAFKPPGLDSDRDLLRRLLADADDSRLPEVCDALVGAGPAAVPVMLAVLDDGPAQARDALVGALVRIGTAAALFGLAERALLPPTR